MRTDIRAYAGFWRRLVATLLDVILIMVLTFPLLTMIYGLGFWDADQTGFIAGPVDFLVSYVSPALASIWFWCRYRGTPGKLIASAYVVDAVTYENINVKQAIVRYLAYFVSLLPLGFGYFWVAVDKRKQGWHDKIAGTVVIYLAPDEPSERAA